MIGPKAKEPTTMIRARSALNQGDESRSAGGSCAATCANSQGKFKDHTMEGGSYERLFVVFSPAADSSPMIRAIELSVTRSFVLLASSTLIVTSSVSRCTF